MLAGASAVSQAFASGGHSSALGVGPDWGNDENPTAVQL
jgi:hypothetical protein